MKHTFAHGETWLDSGKGLVVGSWYGLQVISDSEFDTLVDLDSGETNGFLVSGSTAGQVLDGITIPAGTELEGNFTSASLVSGVSVLYYGKADNLQETNLNYKGVTL